MERKRLQIKFNKSSKIAESPEIVSDEIIETVEDVASEAMPAVEAAEAVAFEAEEVSVQAEEFVVEKSEEITDNTDIIVETEESETEFFADEVSETEAAEEFFFEEETEVTAEDSEIISEEAEEDFFAEAEALEDAEAVSEESEEDFFAEVGEEVEEETEDDFFAAAEESEETDDDFSAVAEESEESEESEYADEETEESEETEETEDNPFSEVDDAIAAQKEVFDNMDESEEVAEEAEEEEVVTDYVVFRDVTKTYTMGETTISALNGINFSANKGELVVVVGASGAGKTTILNILGGIDKASSGEVIIDGKDICKGNNKEMVMYRRHDVGFVFQFYNLVQNLTARENVELATQICTNPFDVDEMLEAVGLSHRKNNFPSQLSGGEQQRVAIARALAKNPKLLLCDEPTGALDYNTGKAILQLLQDTARQAKMTVFIITHNYALTDIGDRVVKVKNGLIEEIIVNDNPMDIKDIEW